eukprot:g5290.t1
MASLVTGEEVRFKGYESIQINRSLTGTSIDAAAGAIAEIVVGIATEGLGLNFASLLGALKAGISSEDEQQEYRKTKVFESEKKLAVIHLSKTLSDRGGSITLFSGTRYKMRVEGEITVIEAKNNEALQELYKVPNQDAAAYLNKLLEEKKDNVVGAKNIKMEEARSEKEHKERERKERERKENQEKERKERERKEKERKERERQEKERKERERKERERKDREHQEKERKDRERQEKERKERERKEREHREIQEKERKERERQEKEREEREHKERERKDREHQEKERKERERKEREQGA